MLSYLAKYVQDGITIMSVCSLTGVASIAVPGELNGYHEAWKKYGRVPWRTLFEPAIALCRNGWLVTESMATSILAAKNEIMKYQNLR